jgi:signal peptidase II
MVKSLIIFVLSFIGIFVIDQNIKSIFLDGYRWDGEFFSLILTYNHGVAFSMFAFLEENLKYIQAFLILCVFGYLLFNRDTFKLYSLPAGIMLGAGCSNLYDRFIHGGVVDYFFWHHWFDFAVFNFADVMINVSVILVLAIAYKNKQ